MKGRVIGFAPKGEECAPKRNQHLFSGTVCLCGRVRLTGRFVGKDLTVEAEAA